MLSGNWIDSVIVFGAIFAPIALILGIGAFLDD